MPLAARILTLLVLTFPSIASAQVFYTNLSAAIGFSSIAADTSARSLGEQLRQDGYYTNERIDYADKGEGMVFWLTGGYKFVPTLSLEIGGYFIFGPYTTISALSYRTVESIVIGGGTVTAVYDVPLSPFFIQGGIHISTVSGSWSYQYVDEQNNVNKNYSGGRGNSVRVGPLLGIGLKHKWAYVGLTLMEGISDTVGSNIIATAGIRFFFW